MAEEVSGDTMPEDILNIFYTGEIPLCAKENLLEQREVPGTRRRMLVVSNQRLMYFEENATGLYDETTFAFARIDSVVFHAGKKCAEFRITDTDGVVTKVGWLANEEAEEILLTLQSAMNELGTAAVSLDRKKSVFSGEEWTLKKPVDYLTKTIRSESVPMSESYVAPILPKSVDDENPEPESAAEEAPFFEDTPEEEMPETVALDQESIRECLRALRLLHEKQIIPEDLYRKLRLPLLEKLDI